MKSLIEWLSITINLLNFQQKEIKKVMCHNLNLRKSCCKIFRAFYGKYVKKMSVVNFLKRFMENSLINYSIKQQTNLFKSIDIFSPQKNEANIFITIYRDMFLNLKTKLIHHFDCWNIVVV